MKILDKPKFFKYPLLQSSFSVVGCIAIFNFFDEFDDKSRVFIIMVVLLLIFIINVIIYCINVKKLYIEYLDVVSRHIELSKQFDKKNDVIKEKNEEIKMYNQNLFELYRVLIIYMSSKTEEEKQKIKDEQLAQLISNLSSKRYLEGGNKNE